MVAVMLTSAVDRVVPAESYDLLALQNMRRCAARDAFGEHQVVDDPRSADIILFVEVFGMGHYQERILRHPLLWRHGARCFGFCSTDMVVPFLPGIYASLPANRFDPARHRSGHYVRALFRHQLRYTEPPASRPLLASFRGLMATHPVRRALREIASPRILVEDTHAKWDMKAHGRRCMGYEPAKLPEFFELFRRSSFALCPRGGGASTFRLFEAMEAGCAPVIISDAWVPPVGPAWETFSVRVAERDVLRIPHVLAELEPRAAEMGRLARAAWEDWFSEESSFHRTIEWCLDIMRTRRPSEPLHRLLAFRRALDEDFARLRRDALWRWRTKLVRLALGR